MTQPTTRRLYSVGTFSASKADVARRAVQELREAHEDTMFQLRQNPSGRFYIVFISEDCCDACMFAEGDDCDCRCGGENHKKGAC